METMNLACQADDDRQLFDVIWALSAVYQQAFGLLASRIRRWIQTTAQAGLFAIFQRLQDA